MDPNSLLGQSCGSGDTLLPPFFKEGEAALLRMVEKCSTVGCFHYINPITWQNFLNVTQFTKRSFSVMVCVCMLVFVHVRVFSFACLGIWWKNRSVCLCHLKEKFRGTESSRFLEP